MYTTPLTLQIIEYTPTSPLRASLAAFWFLVKCRSVNSWTQGKELEELEELDEEVVELVEVGVDEGVEEVVEEVVEEEEGVEVVLDVSGVGVIEGGVEGLEEVEVVVIIFVYINITPEGAGCLVVVR